MVEVGTHATESGRYRRQEGLDRDGKDLDHHGSLLSSLSLNMKDVRKQRAKPECELLLYSTGGRNALLHPLPGNDDGRPCTRTLEIEDGEDQAAAELWFRPATRLKVRFNGVAPPECGVLVSRLDSPPVLIEGLCAGTTVLELRQRLMATMGVPL